MPKIDRREIVTVHDGDPHVATEPIRVLTQHRVWPDGYGQAEGECLECGFVIWGWEFGYDDGPTREQAHGYLLDWEDRVEDYHSFGAHAAYAHAIAYG